MEQDPRRKEDERGFALTSVSPCLQSSLSSLGDESGGKEISLLDSLRKKAHFGVETTRHIFSPSRSRRRTQSALVRGTAPSPSSSPFSSRNSEASHSHPHVRARSGRSSITRISLLDDIEEDPFDQPIEVLRTIPRLSDPYAKLDALVLMRHALHAAITRYRDAHPEKSEGRKAVFLGADDLVSLFQLLLIRSRVRNIYSELQFMQDFLDESFLNGEASYCLTTVLVAAETVEGIPTDA